MPLPVRPPIIVHHKATVPPEVALNGQFPPNSLEAIRACLEANAHFVEIDITALADADYLLVHDPVLETETTGFGLVGECTAERVRGLFIRDAKTGGATASRAPLLSDVVALFQEHPNATRLQLDFKNVYPFPNDEPLRRLVNLIQPLGNRVLLSTGADWQLRRLRKLAGWLELGFDIQNYFDWREPKQPFDPRFPPWKAGTYGYWDDSVLAIYPFLPTPDYLAERCEMLVNSVPTISTFYINFKLLLKSLDDGFNWAEALHRHNIKLDAWTVDADKPNAAENAKRLFDMGVDQFTTNTPAALAKLL